MSITVMGAGAFGTAVAVSLASKGPVTVWARSSQQISKIKETRRNEDRLPGVVLPDALTATAEMDDAARSRIILLAVPMQTLRHVLQTYSAALHDKILVACCKGIELETGLGPVAVMQQTVPDAQHALLTGPSFAHDIARGLPTALTLACSDADCGEELQRELTTANLRLYRSTDTVGAELGGALKNVVAIACGTAMGAKMGESARAALMTRGYAEMQRVAVARGAEPETMAGLSGFGDLALTCTSEQSRNYRLGLSLGRGEEFDPAVTVEGVATARAVQALATELRLDMPITTCVTALVDRRLTPQEAMTHLLARPLKEE
ncbi:NAD(P)H-dependent glycerol-3-phosphate dehydrogenase [Lutimaribacter marinistellae]|uniref:Glycerol-3-phosphate dehydrogenase [NAD(P)+] n=1 Tax=Lutimaribacter marinistellae TaxID=1820329 RepID=A0ABV7TDK0_9RHOB